MYEEIENLIETTKSTYSPYRNIHVFSGTNEIDLDRILGGPDDLELNDDNMVEPHDTDVVKQREDQAPTNYGQLVDGTNNKYVLNIEDVIMELSEEQLSSIMDDSPRRETSSILH